MFARGIMAIVLCAAFVATPATAGDISVHLTLTGGGSLSLSYNPSQSASAVLDGQNQTLTYGLPLTVVDSRSNGAGWNITLTSSALTAGGGKTLNANASSITSTTVGCIDRNGCTDPLNLITYPIPMPTNAAPVKVFDANQQSGMGTFSITPMVAVSIPGNAYAGDYFSTVSVALVSGP